MTDPPLGVLLVARAAGLPCAVMRETPAGREVVVGAMVVAVLEPDALEVRLRGPVAAAALRTPDVESSPRGEGWVRFTPAVVDAFARDRATAWLESAVRRAAEAAAS